MILYMFYDTTVDKIWQKSLQIEYGRGCFLGYGNLNVLVISSVCVVKPFLCFLEFSILNIKTMLSKPRSNIKAWT